LRRSSISVGADGSGKTCVGDATLRPVHQPESQMKQAAVVSAGLVVLALVFWLKVLHASEVCQDAGGFWTGGDCQFEDRDEPIVDAPRR
jgi:hypothetical protein